MSNRRLQFGIRGLLVLVLAAACFFGGWTARERQGETEDKQLHAEVWFSQQRLRYMSEAAKHNALRRLKLEQENANLRGQVEVLEQVVETLNAEIEQPDARNQHAE